MNIRLLCSSLVALLGIVALAPAAEPFELKDGDRVVLLGNTLIEREQRYGYWELALTTRYPDRNITFRNLGWSGDTVWGEARARFGGQAEGFKHLKEHVLELKPTVLIIGYGGNESFDGPAGLPKFEKGLNELLDALAPTKARVVLLAPPQLGNEASRWPKGFPKPLKPPGPERKPSGPPMPDMTEHIKNLRLYSDVLRETASKRSFKLVDLDRISFLVTDQLLTENGVHLTEAGYLLTSDILTRGLEYPFAKWRVEIKANGRTAEATGAKVESLDGPNIRFRITSEALPMTSCKSPDGFGVVDAPRILRVQGLPNGRHSLLIDGEKVDTKTAEQWSRTGVSVTPFGPEYTQSEKLRQLIIEKNRLYFHRWRPQNETYIFGFRNKEQGQNAIEIPKFDPLVAALEAEIAKLRVPVPHVYELKPE